MPRVALAMRWLASALTTNESLRTRVDMEFDGDDYVCCFYVKIHFATIHSCFMIRQWLRQMSTTSCHVASEGLTVRTTFRRCAIAAIVARRVWSNSPGEGALRSLATARIETAGEVCTHVSGIPRISTR